MTRRYPPDYVEHLTRGPFPGSVDPWAEAARYFQQIHSGMIDAILEQIQRPLLAMGYIAGKETSLQIIEGRQPDVFVRREAGSAGAPAQASERWDYAAAATAVMAEPGAEAEEAELQAIHVADANTAQLVTVLEIVSPRNKTQDYVIDEYRQRRARLLLEQGVNVVEIDATRSVKRLLDHPLTSASAGHIAIYLPLENPRVIATDFGEALKRFALPLRKQVLPVETQAAYDRAYRSAAIAGHIHTEGRYIEADLPFPSLLTAAQRQAAVEAVREWERQLETLQQRIP